MKRIFETSISLVILAAPVIHTYRDQGPGMLLGM